MKPLWTLIVCFLEDLVGTALGLTWFWFFLFSFTNVLILLRCWSLSWRVISGCLCHFHVVLLPGCCLLSFSRKQGREGQIKLSIALFSACIIFCLHFCLLGYCIGSPLFPSVLSCVLPVVALSWGRDPNIHHIINKYNELDKQNSNSWIRQSGMEDVLEEPLWWLPRRTL